MISYKRDQRGTVIENSWEGKCLEPVDECPTSCQTDAGFTTQTCFKCNIPATCKGQLSSLFSKRYVVDAPLLRSHLRLSASLSLCLSVCLPKLGCKDFFPCGRLRWLSVNFLLHVKYTLSYRIVSYDTYDTIR